MTILMYPQRWAQQISNMTKFADEFNFKLHVSCVIDVEIVFCLSLSDSNKYNANKFNLLFNP
jgi:hypothetical protein